MPKYEKGSDIKGDGAMMLFRLAMMSFLVMHFFQARTQDHHGTISGTIKSGSNALPYVNVGLKGTGRGAVTDSSGNFKIENIPLGTYDLKVSHIGYEMYSERIVLNMQNRESIRLIELRETMKVLNEIVVSGTRYEKRKLDSAVPVDVLDRRKLESNDALTLSDGLVFQSGIRIEKDCQTCNYTQVRMNGMSGSYTQILLNNRPLFSSLAGLYALEQLPSSMIERVEIVKGGGSVLYGSSAIAGTINIFTRDPSENTFELSTNLASVKGEAADLQTDLYTSVVGKEKRSGISLILSGRQRDPWDANGDGFSELAQMENLSFALNTFLKTGDSGKLTLSLNNIHEVRNGGDRLEMEPHLRLQSEYRKSNIMAGSFDYAKRFYCLRMDMNLFGGVQQTKRKHYTGSFGADGYGKSLSSTYITGIQMNYTLLGFPGGKNVISAGLEYQSDQIKDEIVSYNYLIDQETSQSAVYLQSDWDLFSKFSLVSGIRFTSHNLTDKNIFSPRLSFLYKINNKLQLRISRSSGFRAPQTFDADMHIAFSGGGITLTEIDPELKPETSQSYTGSLDYNLATHDYIYGFSFAAFYNVLENTFILEEKPDQANPTQTTLYRTNGGSTFIKGITLEARGNYNYKYEGDVGITLQKGRYEKPVKWSENLNGSSEMMRTPDIYGYFSFSAVFWKYSKVICSGIYTGSMYVPHFAGAPETPNDELVKTSSFFELNLKLERNFNALFKRLNISTSVGVQNVFDSFQRDFDSGPNRDSNYMYGPGRPRTWFLAVKIKPA